MPTQESEQTLKDLLSSFDLSGKSEKDLLIYYYKLKSFADPELRSILNEQQEAITSALQNNDVSKLEGVLRQSIVAFEKHISSLPEQIATPIQLQTPEAPFDNTILERRANETVEVLNTPLPDVPKQKTQPPRSFVERVVGRFTGRDDFLRAAKKNIADAKKTAESQPQKEVSVDQEAPVKETRAELPNPLIEATLNSEHPAFLRKAFDERYTTVIEPIKKTVARAAHIASVADAIPTAPQNSIDYSNVFKNLSGTKGTVVEKTLAPVADVIFSLFPKEMQETIVSKVLGASWNKEVSNNAWLQKVLSPTLQSSTIQQAIQKGNILFESAGKGAVFTKTQSFFVDVFVTVFHPEVSETYLTLAGLGNAQMGGSIGQYYLGLLADRGASYAAGKAAKTAGKVVVEKAGGAAVGKVIGGILGSEGGPVGAFIGSVVFDKIIGGLVSGAKKVFSFLTLDWLGKLVSGSYEAGPITKDPIFMGAAIVVGVVCLLFVIPLTPFTIGGNSSFQQTVQDNAFIQGVGGSGAGPVVDCVAEPDNPLCSMSACDTTKQDCRWPTSGTITQGPYTSCGGSHAHANAIDIGAANGTDVYATIDGTVTVFSGCTDNTGYWGNTCGGGYGNWILVQGSSYSLLFGHLSRLSIAVHNGDHVSPTTVIGEVDHTGNSSGPHLHFEYRGPGSINSILPTAIPSCSNNTSGCPSCPSLTVGGGK